MLPEVKTGHLICKQKYAPPLTYIDPNFGVEYNEEIHGKMLRNKLDVSHPTYSQQTTFAALIRNTGMSSAKKVLIHPASKTTNVRLTLVTLSLLLVEMPPLTHKNFQSSKKLSPDFFHQGVFNKYMTANGSQSLS